MNDNSYIMWLTLIEGLGIKKCQQLLKDFSSAEEIFKAPRRILEKVSYLNDKNIFNILKAQDIDLLKSRIKNLEDENVQYLTINDKDYPSLLKEISYPPTCIYLKGNLPKDDIPKVSVVGARRASEYGMNVAYKLSKDLAKNEVVIVSGMARGIDSMSHKGALDVKGHTIAVLGFGFNECYPKENRNLMEIIARDGCLISEYPPHTKPLPVYFSTRNRIISGISNATIVVEASEKSGTLITVNEALAEGREVMAVPGNITSKLSRGTNELIRDGATIITNFKDVLYELGIDNNNDNLLKHSNNYENISKNFSSEENLLYRNLSFEPITIDELIIKLKSDAPTVNYILTILELKGYIQKLSGQRYIRTL